MAAKASVTKQCVYCLRLVPPSDVTDDHVIARSWYPNDTPPIGKWKAPACSSCNNRYSAPEKDILGRMAFCMDPAEPALGDIVQQARRAIDPRQAKSARDAIHRSNRREKLRQSVISVHNPDAPGILPSFRSNFSSGSRTGILIPARPLNAVIEKWIRGIHYCEFGKPIPTDYDVSIQLVSDENAEEIFGEIIRHAKQIRKGPGVEVLIWHAEERGEFVAQYAFNIWNQFRAYGSADSHKPLA